MCGGICIGRQWHTNDCQACKIGTYFAIKDSECITTCPSSYTPSERTSMCISDADSGFSDPLPEKEALGTASTEIDARDFGYPESQLETSKFTWFCSLTSGKPCSNSLLFNAAPSTDHHLVVPAGEYISDVPHYITMYAENTAENKSYSYRLKMIFAEEIPLNSTSFTEEICASRSSTLQLPVSDDPDDYDITFNSATDIQYEQNTIFIPAWTTPQDQPPSQIVIEARLVYKADQKVKLGYYQIPINQPPTNGTLSLSYLSEGQLQAELKQWTDTHSPLMYSLKYVDNRGAEQTLFDYQSSTTVQFAGSFQLNDIVSLVLYIKDAQSCVAAYQRSVVVGDERSPTLTFNRLASASAGAIIATEVMLVTSSLIRGLSRGAQANVVVSYEGSAASTFIQGHSLSSLYSLVVLWR